jgi:hypothetical protein
MIFIPSILFGQKIRLKESVSDSNSPQMVWLTTGAIDSVEFNVYRSKAGKSNFNPINTIHFAHEFDGSDTIEFTVIDTTLQEKGLFEYSIEIQRNGKTVHSEIALGHNFGLLPKPHLTNFTATPLTDRKAIQLKWSIDYSETISSLELYRSRNYDDGYIKVTDLPVDTSSFTDVVPVANEPWFYFIVMNDFFGSKTQSVRIPAFATFSEKPFQPQNIHGNFRNDSIIIDWKNTGANIIGYRVYRSNKGNPFQLVSDMEENVSDTAIFIDTSEVVKNSVLLKYYICNVSDGFVESTPSDTLSFYILAHEQVLAPQIPDFITDENGNIKLLWMPAAGNSVRGYNIYLTAPESEPVKLNDSLFAQNSYTDTVFRSPGKYIYEVESVGFNNKVSGNKSATTVYRYPLRVHVILDVKKQNGGFAISWKQPLNNHIKTITLEKQTEDGKVTELKTVANISDTSVTDKDLKNGNTYLYKLTATLDSGDKIILNEGVEMIW